MNAARLAALCAVLIAPGRAPAAPAPTPIAIVGAKVHLDPGKTLEDATIVLRGDRIAAVGTNVAVPADARRIDGRGLVVTAGFIESLSTMGLVEIPGERSSNDVPLEGGDDDRVHAAYRAVDGYNPSSVSIPIARAGGVTSVVAAPSGGFVAGVSAWLTLAQARTTPEVTVKAPLAMHMVLGGPAQPLVQGSRGMAIERARELLDDAREYARRRGDYERNATRGFSASRLDLEALAPVVQGRLPLAIRADRSVDILAAIRLAEEFKVKVIVVGAAEGWLVAGELAKAKIPVIVDPTDNLPYSFDVLRAREDNPARLADAGVLVAISTMSEPGFVRTLRQLAGVAVANGMRWEQALAAVTTVPAAIYGVRDRGVIAVGAAADLVVWTGDPFELSTRVAHVFIGGAEQSLRTRQTLLLERYR